MKLFYPLLVISFFVISCGETKKKDKQEAKQNITEQACKHKTDKPSCTAKDTEDVKNTIISLFDGVRESDAKKISSALTPEAIFVSSKEKDGKTVESETKGKNFALKAGAKHDEVWDERVTDIKVEFTGDKAKAKANYEFYLGEKYSHKGKMVVDLIRTEECWAIRKVWYSIEK